MLSALTDLNAYMSARSLSSGQLVVIGDFDNSNSVTNRDIQGLLDLIANQPGGGSVSAVPEPSTLTLLLLAAPAWALRISRRAQPVGDCPNFAVPGTGRGLSRFSDAR
jgi:hypothetical protein